MLSRDKNRQRTLLPMRTVDEALLTGGKLSRFQSIALLVTRMAVVFFVGVPMLLVERAIAAEAAAQGEYFRNVSPVVLGLAMIALGLLIATNGVISQWHLSRRKLQGQRGGVKPGA